MDASVIAEWPLEDGDAFFASEEKKRKLEDDIGEREEKVEGPSQVLPPSCPSVFSGDDSEDDGESEGAEESVFSGDDSEVDGESEGAEVSLFSGDDSEAEEEPPLDPKVKEKYSQLIRESEGDLFGPPLFPWLELRSHLLMKVLLTSLDGPSESIPLFITRHMSSSIW